MTEKSSTPDTFTSQFQEAPFFEKHPQGFGQMELLDEIKIDQVYVLPVPHLTEWLPEKHEHAVNIRKIDTQVRIDSQHLLYQTLKLTFAYIYPCDIFTEK